MCQHSTTMARTTTPPMTFLYSSSSSLLTTVTMALSLMGFPAMSGQHYVVPTTADARALWRCCWPCHCATAATSVSDTSSGLCQLCHGSSTGKFLFQSWASHCFFKKCKCLFWCMPSVFRCIVRCHIHLLGLNCWGLHHHNLLELTQGRHMCNLVMVIGPHWECSEGLLPLLLWVGGAFYYSISWPPVVPTIWWGICFGGLAKSHPLPPPFMHCGEGSSVPGLVPPNDTVESVVAIKPADSGVAIGYQVDEFTHTWSAEQFVAHSHIYPGFMGKVSSRNHSPLEWGCEDYYFLEQAITVFEQSLDSTLTDSIETPDLDTSLDEPDVIISSVSSQFLYMVSTIFDTSKLQLAPSIRSHKLWCQARALLSPVSLATKMLPSKFNHCFSSHNATFGFQSFTPPNNITLTSANRKVDQSLSEFQTGIGAANHVTLDTGELISHLRVSLVNTLSSLSNCEGGIIPISEVHEFLLKVHDILDNAVSKWVGNSAHISAHVFNSASRQHSEVLASQFIFLYGLKDVVAHSQVCQYGCINWSPAQTEQQSSMGFS